MKTQVLKMFYNGEYRVVYDTEKAVNPYTIYRIWRETTECGVRTHKRAIQKYGDFASCLYHIWSIVSS